MLLVHWHDYLLGFDVGVDNVYGIDVNRRDARVFSGSVFGSGAGRRRAETRPGQEIVPATTETCHDRHLAPVFAYCVVVLPEIKDDSVFSDKNSKARCVGITAAGCCSERCGIVFERRVQTYPLLFGGTATLPRGQ